MVYLFLNIDQDLLSNTVDGMCLISICIYMYLVTNMYKEEDMVALVILEVVPGVEDFLL